MERSSCNNQHDANLNTCNDDNLRMTLGTRISTTRRWKTKQKQEKVSLSLF